MNDHGSTDRTCTAGPAVGSGRSMPPARRSPVVGPGRGPVGRRALLVLGIIAVFALCFAAIKAGLSFAPPLRFAGLRALIAGGILLGAMLLVRQPLVPDRRHWRGLLALALSATTLAFGAMFLSPGRTGAGIASLLGNTQPLIVAALAPLVLGERMTPGKWTALAFGLTGVALISSAALAGPDAAAFEGALLALLASAGTALGSVIVKRMGASRALLTITAWSLVLGSLPLLATSAVLERDTTTIWSATFVSLLLFLAAPGTAVVTTAWYWLVQRHDVGRLTMFLFLVPVFGLAIAAIAFGERLTPREGLGALFTLAAVAAVTWERRPAGPPLA